jgi:indole-3-glycerol phosphate synthase
MPNGAVDHLGAILERKRIENVRRRAHAQLAARLMNAAAVAPPQDRGALALARLRRAQRDPVRVIAEIKLRSPSAGAIRIRARGAVQALAREYEGGGAAAISVLCDGKGFGGSPLDVRRAASTVAVPLLFKEFVLDEVQVALARVLGAHMVLLLVRALPPDRLNLLVDEVLRQGMAPVVEAADEDELQLALRTRATIVGVNARDLRTFRVDPKRARRAVELIPADRIAVRMSGITSADELARVASSRADAALVGEALMRAPSPGAQLRAWLEAAGTRR